MKLKIMAPSNNPQTSNFIKCLCNCYQSNQSISSKQLSNTVQFHPLLAHKSKISIKSKLTKQHPPLQARPQPAATLNNPQLMPKHHPKQYYQLHHQPSPISTIKYIPQYTSYPSFKTITYKPHIHYRSTKQLFANITDNKPVYLNKQEQPDGLQQSVNTDKNRQKQLSKSEPLDKMVMRRTFSIEEDIQQPNQSIIINKLKLYQLKS